MREHVFSLEALYDFLGPSVVARGIPYADNSQVAYARFDDVQKQISGFVRNDRGDTYRTVAYVELVEDQWTFDGSDCSCPVGGDCKHVAALCYLFTNPKPSTRPPNWRRTLDSVLPQSFPDAGTPIGVELSVTFEGVTARLVRPGKTRKWVAGRLSWSGATSLLHSGEHPHSQLSWARELFTAVSSTAAPAPSWRPQYGTTTSLDLAQFDSPQLWTMLDKAKRLGITLVDAETGEEIGPIQTASLVFDVRQSEDGSLLVTPSVRVGDQTIKPALFVGTHGVAWTDPIARLARFESPIPTQLRSMFLARTPMSIPADEAGSFLIDYFPRLKSLAPVTSVDGSFSAPEIEGPTLALAAEFGEGHSVSLTWEWLYHLGKHPARSSLRSARSLAGYRDAEAEKNLLAAVNDLIAPFAVANQRLAAMDTLRFATEVLPKFVDRPEIDVTVTGESVDYRETGDVVISVTTDQTAESDWFDLGVSVAADGQDVPFVTLFSALAAGDSHLLLPGGAYFALDKPELHQLRTLITEARGIGETRSGKMRISRFQADLFDELAALGVVSRQARAWQEQVAGLRSLNSVEPTPLPSALKADLRHYQVDGFNWLATLHRHSLGGVLADDMGLGKTLQSLALMLHVREHNPDTPPFLVVVPSSVIANWSIETARFAPDIPLVAITDTLRKSGAQMPDLIAGAGLVVTSYTLFRLDFEAYAEQTWAGLFLDEAQFVKNRKSQTYHCARRLPAPLKVAITGTPMENNVMELWSLLSITAPGLFPDPKRFEDHYAKPIEKDNDRAQLAQLRRRIKPLVLRRTKELVAKELPDKQVQLMSVVLSPRHRALYDRRLQRERQAVLGMLDDMRRNRFSILKSLTTLRQMALHPALVEPGHEAIASAKIDFLVEQLEDVAGGGHRALVFSQFTTFLRRVRDRLDHEGIGYCYLDGRTRNRPEVIEKFKSGTDPVFLISLKAGGFGLNLTEADYCFLLDPWWNPAAEEQAIDRTHRIGQTRNVMVYRLIAKNTIEEKVVALNERKAKLFTSVIDDGDAFSAALTAEDVRGLLG